MNKKLALPGRALAGKPPVAPISVPQAAPISVPQAAPISVPQVAHGQAPSAGAAPVVRMILAAVALALAGCATAPRHADLVVTGARVWTGVPGAADAEALAVRGERIVAVGRDADVRALIGPGTKVIEARGRRIIPGITDSHIHIIGGGLQLARLNLRDVPDRAAFIAAIADAARGAGPGDWVLGGRWSAESWPDPSPPTRGWIDGVTGDVPVFLSRMDGHQALVNSAALRRAGIEGSGFRVQGSGEEKRDQGSGVVDPPGGEIERDPSTGEPTGILKESAMDLVAQHVPAPDEVQMYQALMRAQKHLNALGITAVQDMCDPEHLRVFRRAFDRGELTIRLHAFVTAAEWEPWTETVAKYPVSDDMYRVAGLKGYMDGSLGSRTAYMREPYRDADSTTRYPRGQLTSFADPPDRLNQAAAHADARGLQLAVHAIGDEGIHLLLDAYEYALNDSGPHDARHRVEHAQHLLVEDIPRFARLGVIASMQPFHKADDGRYAEKALGPQRLPGSYAFRQLVDAGAAVTFGSDWPVVTADPFAGIDSAVNGLTLEGNVWLPTHSLTVEEALRAYTVTPAYAAHQENVRGTLGVGKLADFVLLSDDPLTIAPSELSSVQARLTVVNGRVVYGK